MIQHDKKPFVLSVLSTKGGVTKTTNAANISAFCADHGLRVLMIDTDVQPSLSSYYEITHTAPKGVYEFLIDKVTEPEQIISHTQIANLDIIQSNDPSGKLSLLLKEADDGAIRFHYLLQSIQGYDLIVVDTRRTRDISLSAVLASDLILSPVLPEMLSTREFIRGTLNLYQNLSTYQHFGFHLPPIKVLANRVDYTNNAKEILKTIKSLIQDHSITDVTSLDITIPARVAYREANAYCTPIHRYAPNEYEVMQTLCSTLFPQFSHRFLKKHLRTIQNAS